MILHGSGEVISNYSRGSSAGGIVRVDGPATVQIELYYFPGWRVYVDGVAVTPRISDPHGLMEVDVPAGEHYIDARHGVHARPQDRRGAGLGGAARDRGSVGLAGTYASGTCAKRDIGQRRIDCAAGSQIAVDVDEVIYRGLGGRRIGRVVANGLPDRSQVA